MRIALVIERFDPSRGGREKSTAQIASRLAARGCEVTVLCQDGRAMDGVSVRTLGRSGLLRSSRLDAFVRAAQREIAGGQFPVAHAMLPVPGANVYQPRGGTVPAQIAASVRRRGALGGALVTLTEPFNLHRRRMGELERTVMADPQTLCLAVSQMVAREFEEYYGRTANVRVIYNAADVPDPDSPDRADWRQKRRFQLGIGAGDPVFLIVAQNFALKGVLEAIAAFAEFYHAHFGQTNARLVVVGRDLAEGYQRVAGLRDVGQQVVFVPQTDEVFQWYAAADAVVLPTWYDPCSRVILEAVRWGIPAVTTIFNGAAEVLADGAGIVISSPDDRKALVAALNELVDPRRRAERSARCLRAADGLGVDRHVDELLSAYEEVARAR
ncbi:MAG TPA: hypothetical protein DCX07_06725 [Phycisphaerales bacterium]|nr:hypothetical protein [Phycisphaerales bacterium]